MWKLNTKNKNTYKNICTNERKEIIIIIRINKLKIEREKEFDEKKSVQITFALSVSAPFRNELLNSTD